VFALVASPFVETVLVDADTVFLHAPDAVWDENEGLRTTGVLLFKDMTRPIKNNAARLWLSSFMHPSPTLRETRLFRGLSKDEVESGVVFVNKRLHVAGVLVIAAINDPTRRAEFWRTLHGDKESFLLGLEMTGEPYFLSPHGAGVAGALRSEGRVCGFQLAHVDPTRGDRLLWWNQGMAKYKVRCLLPALCAALIITSIICTRLRAPSCRPGLMKTPRNGIGRTTGQPRSCA
jgi:hypothetical protein